jgi:8-oxo-dGTP pyrophosphatase MutT (NUDIX family)
MWQKSPDHDDKRVESAVTADQRVDVVRPELGSVESLATFLTGRLRDPLPGPSAQGRFAPRPLIEGWSPEEMPETARRAAALLMLYPGAQGPSIALTLRDASLPTHPGQVSLPGGAIDSGESPEAAALREAREEIGITTDHVDVLGAMSTLWIVVSNFVLTPIVSVSAVRPEFRLNHREVAALVELPVTRLFDHTCLGWAHRTRDGARVDYPYIRVDGHVIWGATAMVLCEFACLFDPDHAPPSRPTED